MAKRGRPLKEIDQKKFEELCKINCTLEEVCSVMGVSNKTLEGWCKRTYDGDNFSEAYKRFSANGKVALRRFQFKQARTNPTMAIWLGKQHLGQEDKVEQQHSGQVTYRLILDDIEPSPDGGDSPDGGVPRPEAAPGPAGHLEGDRPV